MDTDNNSKRVYRVVLTGGPCGGKTTGQSRLCTFFENLGWKVFRVPKTAIVLQSGGIKFSDLSEDESYKIQVHLIRTMIQIEDTYFNLADSCTRNCLVICDGGFMDALAHIPSERIDDLMTKNGWNFIDMRDNRYNQIIHLVSAVYGDEKFYSTEDHESIESAKILDKKSAEAWINHPCLDVIDNSTDFESKMNKMIEVVCQKLGIDTGHILKTSSRQHKFLITKLPDDNIQNFEQQSLSH